MFRPIRILFNQRSFDDQYKTWSYFLRIPYGLYILPGAMLRGSSCFMTMTWGGVLPCYSIVINVPVTWKRCAINAAVTNQSATSLIIFINYKVNKRIQ